MKYSVINGNNIDVLKQFPDNHFDSIVTDPPYGIDFLGKEWDANVGALATYQECLRVLKPGGYLLAFSAARTYHHLAVTVEQAGFDIRDQIMWIYSSGFPKSQDIGKSIDRQSGKAAHKQELAEVKAILKQLYQESGKSVGQIDRECGFNAGGYLKTDFKDKGWANNLPKNDKWLKLKSVLGCGDDYDDYFITTPQVKVGEKQAGCFGEGSDYTIGGRSQTVDVTQSQTEAGKQWSGWGTQLKPAHEPIVVAQKPTKLSFAKNCQKWGVGALNIDATRVERSKEEKDIVREINAKGGIGIGDGIEKYGTIGSDGNSSAGKVKLNENRFPSNVIGEIPEYQKYFYWPKVGRAERHIGCVDPGPMFKRPRDENGKPVGEGESMWMDPKVSGPKKIAEQPAGTNNHPTVKPIELMKYLIQLVTPAGGKVLDPFNGSGSTGCAAVELDYDYTGIELDPKYVDIARKRIEAWYKHTHPNTFKELFE